MSYNKRDFDVVITKNLQLLWGTAPQTPCFRDTPMCSDPPLRKSWIRPVLGVLKSPDNQIIKNFAWEDQSQKQCYIADIEPKTREQCYIG